MISIQPTNASSIHASQEHRANLLWIPEKSEYNTHQVKGQKKGSASPHTILRARLNIDISGLARYQLQKEWEGSKYSDQNGRCPHS